MPQSLLKSNKLAFRRLLANSGPRGTAPIGIKHEKKQDNKIAGLAKALRNELKFSQQQNLANQATTATSLGTEFYLSAIAQGLNTGDRVGDSVQYKWITLKWRFIANTGTANGLVRCIIFQDFGNIGASPQAALQTNVMAGTVANITAPAQTFRYDLMLRSKKNRDGRFKVLYDSGTRPIGPLSTAATFATATDNSQVVLNKIIRVNSPTKFIGTGATAASAGYGTIWMYTMSSDATNISELGHVSCHFSDH